MTLEEAHKIINRISYKKDAHFNITQGTTRHINLSFYDRAPDSRGLAEMLNVAAYETFTTEFFSTLDEKEFLYFIKQIVRRREMHEVDEWLKIDGKCLTDPHPTGFLPQLELK